MVKHKIEVSVPKENIKKFEKSGFGMFVHLCGVYASFNIKDKIKSIAWLDNDEELDFSQKDGMLTINLTGTPYGTSYCVRVAKAYL